MRSCRSCLPPALVVGLLSCLLWTCSDDSGTKDAAVKDAGVNDKTVTDVLTSDTSNKVDKETGDSAQPVACSKPSDSCPGSLGCLCCGSIGPSPICLCSMACAGASDCAGTGLPECNMAQGADTGICTPVGYNCCWMCQ